MKALEGKSKEEIQVIKDMYQKEYGESLEDRLEDELSGTDLKEATAKLSADPVQIAVSKMQNAPTRRRSTRPSKASPTPRCASRWPRSTRSRPATA